MKAHEHWIVDVYEDDNYEHFNAVRLLTSSVVDTIEEAIDHAQSVMDVDKYGTWIVISTEFQDLGVQVEWGRDIYGQWMLLADPNNIVKSEDEEEHYCDDCS